MDINHNYNVGPAFGNITKNLRISKSAQYIMLCRGEWDAFEKVLPELQEAAKDSRITVYATHMLQGMKPSTTYGMTIRPKNTLTDNVITRALGLSKTKGQGDAFYSINQNRADENIFRSLYESAVRNRK